MTTMLRIGDTVQLRAFLWDGLAAVTGATLNVSIERVSDGKFWTGSAFQTDYIAIEMTERTGNVHKEGEYIYAFMPPSADGVEAYNWSCKHDDDPTLIYKKGRILTYRQATITLGAVTMSVEAGNRRVSPVTLEMEQGETKTFTIAVLDADENPVVLTDKTLRFAVHDSNDPTNDVFQVDEGEDIALDEGDTVALVTVDKTKSTTASDEWHWKLWDIDADGVLAKGAFIVGAAGKGS